jgi:hypothetical protein
LLLLVTIIGGGSGWDWDWGFLGLPRGLEGWGGEEEGRGGVDLGIMYEFLTIESKPSDFKRFKWWVNKVVCEGGSWSL